MDVPLIENSVLASLTVAKGRTARQLPGIDRAQSGPVLGIETLKHPAYAHPTPAPLTVVHVTGHVLKVRRARGDAAVGARTAHSPAVAIRGQSLVKLADVAVETQWSRDAILRKLVVQRSRDRGNFVWVRQLDASRTDHRDRLEFFRTHNRSKSPLTAGG